MLEKHTPHDAFFKSLFGDPEQAKSFIEHYMPDVIRNHIDLSTLEVMKSSFVDEELTRYFTDILYKVNIQGKKAYLYILFDHKSSPDKEITFQLLKYVVKIWESERQKQKVWKKLPIVIPCVFYHGKKEWNIGLKLSDIVEISNEVFIRYVPNFEYVLTDISRYNDEEIDGDVKLMLGLQLLKHIFDNPEKILSLLPKLGELLKETIATESGISFLITFLSYLFTTEVSSEVVEEVFKETLSEKGEEILMSTYQKILEKGKKEGMEKGRREGIEEGIEKGIEKGLLEDSREMVLEALDERFGKVPNDVSNAVTNIEDRDKLKSLLRQAIRCVSMEEFRKSLNGQIKK